MPADTIAPHDATPWVAPQLAASRCHRCPEEGGEVVALFSGDGPAHRAGHRAWQETESSGHPHHDHYDPTLDAFVVIRHPREGAA